MTFMTPDYQVLLSVVPWTFIFKAIILLNNLFFIFYSSHIFALHWLFPRPPVYSLILCYPIKYRNSGNCNPNMLNATRLLCISKEFPNFFTPIFITGLLIDNFTSTVLLSFSLLMFETCSRIPCTPCSSTYESNQKYLYRK